VYELSASEYVLELCSISKSFGNLKANDNITVRIKRGSVHAIIGENGAGKSTLMNIITDIYKPDRGEILLNGRRVQFKNPMDATRHGIGMVYQEFMLFEDLTVLENIIMGFEDRKFYLFLDKKASRQKVEEICKKYRFNLSLDTKIKDLPVAVLQQVEIVKVLFRGADILILDEPTSVLTPIGIEGLFEAIKYLKDIGKTIIIITHKLKEVFAIADYITVLKNGRVSGHVLPDEVDERKLASLMVGREVVLQGQKIKSVIGNSVLEVQNLSVKDSSGIMRTKRLNFTVHSGEIVGIAGVAGSGQQQLIEAVIGLILPEAGGDIIFNGRSIVRQSISQRRADGIGYVPQDRMTEGTNPKGTIWENAIMGYHLVHGFSSKIFLKRKEIKEFSESIINQYSVKAQGIDNRITSLSGGNIQKLVVGREFIQNNRLLIIEDPTRGIDVGAIEFVWKKIVNIAAAGTAVLMISHELNEVMQLSDRILVMYNGELFEAGKHGELSENEIGLLMTGGGRQNDAI
jgi:simple sugar transport system ATP-binding protein